MFHLASSEHAFRNLYCVELKAYKPNLAAGSSPKKHLAAPPLPLPLVDHTD